jgi:hypothetical protein
MPYDAELESALDAARQAGLKLKTLYENFKAIPNAPADISTEADRQSQEIVLKLHSLRGRLVSSGVALSAAKGSG